MDSSSDAMMCTFDCIQGTGWRPCVNKPSVKRTSRSLENRTVSDAAPLLRVIPTRIIEETVPPAPTSGRFLARVGSKDQEEESNRGQRRRGKKSNRMSDHDQSSAAEAYVVLLAV